MPLSAPSSPSQALRQALMASLCQQHRPELADLVATAELDLDFPSLWLQLEDPALSPVWLEAKLLAAATERLAARLDPCARRPPGQGSVTAPLGSPLSAGGIQPTWWCRACGNSALLALGFCRRCYDRRRHSERYFAGHREAVLTRDGCCQLCLAQTGLVVHHRRPGVKRPRWQLTLCQRCHVRVHRRRRDELVRLECRHLQRREERWVLLDIQGKERRLRTVPVPHWVKRLVDPWLEASGIAARAVVPDFAQGRQTRAGRGGE